MQFATLPLSAHPLIHLRPLTEADIGPWASYLNDPTVYQHTSWNHPTASELESYLGNESDSDPASPLRLAIASLEDNVLAGTIGFHTVSPANHSAELAYDLHPGYWGKGFATIAATAMLRWAHSEVGLVRVQATVLTSNTPSIRVLERLGFVREGLLRSYRFVRGEPGDFYMYAHVMSDSGVTSESHY